MKDDLLEIVRKNLDNNKLLNLIDEDIRNTAYNTFYASEEEGGFNEEGEIYYETEGCDYDNIVDNLDFSKIANDEVEEDVLNKLIEILKRDYDLANFEILESFDKVNLTFEEAIQELFEKENEEYYKKNNKYLEYTIQVNEYDKFYPTSEGFKSVKGSDHTMTVINKIFPENALNEFKNMVIEEIKGMNLKEFCVDLDEIENPNIKNWVKKNGEYLNGYYYIKKETVI